MTEVVRPYRGVSAEERRSQRRVQLLEALLDVVAEVGVADTTAEAVCAKAGLSKRYFYESFGDRDAILVAALDDVFAGVRGAIGAALGSAPADPIQATVSALVTTLAADPRAARLYVEAPRSVATEQRRLLAFEEFALVVNDVLEMSEDDPTSYATALFVVSGTTEVLAHWLDGRLSLAETDVVDLISGIGRRVATQPSD